MPEVGIGLFPDVGSTYFLDKAPGSTGRYLSVTGNSINASDMLYCGLATHYIPTERMDELIENLAGAGGDIKPVLDSMNDIPEEAGFLVNHRDIIDECFSHDSIERILDALYKNGSEFALKSAKIIEIRSPVSLKVSLLNMIKAKGRSFSEAVEQDYTIVQHILKQHDFYEGVRATVIDKDRQPKWQPSRIEDVSDEFLDSIFVSTGKKLF
jgi:enoyl-CoA hydratase/carnithine racemase